MINEDLYARIGMNMDFARFWQVPAQEQSKDSDVTKRVLTSPDSCLVNFVSFSTTHNAIEKYQVTDFPW